MEIIKQDIVIPAEVVDDLQLTATLPQEMVAAQVQLIGWCDKKADSLRAEAAELLEATTQAREAGWKYSVLQSQYNKTLKRVLYYEKVKIALEHGYYIVPNFGVQMFAIRTKRKSPAAKCTGNYWGDKQQDAQELQPGEGEYKNPFPLTERESILKSDGTREAFSQATNWDDLEFPITMAKPNIMEATNRAMALRVFDEIGIFPKTKKEDPVILGRIINGKKVVSFMIAWHLDTKMI